MSESQNIEYKSSWRDEYLKWICAFANTNVGSLHIGKDDNGKIIGISDSKKLLEDIPNKIVNVLGATADVNLKKEKGKEYIEIKIKQYDVPVSYR